VGVGTASALLAHADFLRRRRLRVVGVDYDAAYVAAAAEAVAAAGMADVIQVVHASIYDYEPATATAMVAGGGAHRDAGPPLGVTTYDAAYFSGSFMILPDQGAALAKVAALVRAPEGGDDGWDGGGGGDNVGDGSDGLGRLYWTQTFEGPRRADGGGWVEWLKPRLAALTSVDFGRVTYVDEFTAVLEGGGVTVEDEVVLGGEEGQRCAKLVVGYVGEARGSAL